MVGFRQTWIAVAGAALAMVLVGCGGGEEPQPAENAAAPAQPAAELSEEEKEIAQALAKLSPEDRALAEKQKFCLVSDGERLGSMGVPFKVEVDGKTVFLCCEGCKGPLLKDKEKFLAKLEQEMKKPAETE